MNELQIVSREDEVSVHLSPAGEAYFAAEVVGSGLKARARVSKYLSHGLGSFFRGCAEDWRGWEGTRIWSSLEEELRFSAETDKLGHVFLEIRLRDGTPPHWELVVKLVVEAGQLDRLAAHAESFDRSLFREGDAR